MEVKCQIITKVLFSISKILKFILNSSLGKKKDREKSVSYKLNMKAIGMLFYFDKNIGSK